MAEDTDYFAVSREYAAGLYKLLEVIEKSPQTYGPFVKGQMVGPITLAGNLRDLTGKLPFTTARLRIPLSRA